MRDSVWLGEEVRRELVFAFDVLVTGEWASPGNGGLLVRVVDFVGCWVRKN